jgi:hypothetical protein
MLYVPAILFFAEYILIWENIHKVNPQYLCISSYRRYIYGDEVARLMRKYI